MQGRVPHESTSDINQLVVVISALEIPMDCQARLRITITYINKNFRIRYYRTRRVAIVLFCFLADFDDAGSGYL